MILNTFLCSRVLTGIYVKGGVQYHVNFRNVLPFYLICQ